jgi:hypothetical protein
MSALQRVVTSRLSASGIFGFGLLFGLYIQRLAGLFARNVLLNNEVIFAYFLDPRNFCKERFAIQLLPKLKRGRAWTTTFVVGVGGIIGFC